MRMQICFLLLIFSLSASGCLNVQPPPCADGVRDGTESDIDCGGSCAACASGRLCRTGSDCQSGICGIDGRCAGATSSCTNAVRDGNESDIDCGGSCPACANGRRCYASSDCQSGICAAGLCSSVRYQGGGIPPSSTATYRILPGASTVVQPGVQAGYGITANVGGVYRLVWTGDANTSGTYREFWGSVWTPGAFIYVTRGCAGNFCPLEQEDYVSNPFQVAGGQRIDFDGFTTNGLDGFDFQVSAEPVYFDLYIDGVRYPNLVFFPATDNGGAVSNVGTIPFGLVTQ